MDNLSNNNNKMNLNRVITDIKGIPVKKSGMSQEELEKFANADGKVKTKDLPNETVSNVIIVALYEYPITHKKQTFMVNSIAQEVLKAKKELELSKDLKSFLIEVLYSSIVQKKEAKKETEEDKVIGIYPSYTIYQVLDELGVKEYKE